MRPFRARHTLRKSQRIIDKGSISRFLEVSGELVHVKQSLKNKHSKDVTYCRDDSRDRRVARDDYDVDDDFSSGHDEEEDDGDGDDDELCWGYDDKDWLPKSQLGIRSHPHVDDDVHHVDRVRQVGPAHRDSKLTANDYVKSSMDESYNFHSDCGRGYGTIEAYTCDDGVDNHSRSIGYAGCSNIVAYVRCKRKLSSIMQRSKLRNMHCLPGWIEKKRRVLYQRQHKVNKWACAIQLDLDSNFHAYNEQFAAVKEVEEAGSQAMPQVFEGSNNVTFLQMPTQPSSPPVFLRTVLEGLPNDPLESVHIEGPHEAHSAYISLSPKQNNLSRSLPHHAKKLGPNSAKTISFENCVKKRKRKKHRPKVLCDVFYQGKYTRKTRKKSFSEQVKNSDLKDKQSKSPREPHLKKTRKTRKKSFSEQVTNWDLKDKQSKLPREPHIKKKQALKSSTYTTKGKLTQKQRATLIIKNINILECKNLNVLRSSKLSEGQSLAPYRVGDWTGIGGPLKDGWALQNLLDEVAFSSKGSVIPFPIYREVIFKNLGSLKFSFENQVKLIQELTKGFRGYEMAFVREQRQSVPLCESGSWHGPVEFIKETGVFSPMWSKAEVSSPLAVIQNLNNQLEVVATDQSRELINVKPRRVSSKIRAEVQLDPESERIWPLIASGGIPEMFEDVLHWERERPLMERQVRSFIDIMKSVQGDRHFSPWKGSVLDSLAGVFLTQNVSDRLSSSAFMSLAARYPFKQAAISLRTDKCEDSLHVLEGRTIPSFMQSDEQEKNREHLNTQENFDFCCTSHQECVLLASKLPEECQKHHKNKISLKAVKKTLRNASISHTKDIYLSRPQVSSIKPFIDQDSALDNEDNLHVGSLSPTWKYQEKDVTRNPECTNIAGSLIRQGGACQDQGFSPSQPEVNPSIEETDFCSLRLNQDSVDSVIQATPYAAHNLEKSFQHSSKEHLFVLPRNLSISDVNDGSEKGLHQPQRLSFCSGNSQNEVMNCTTYSTSATTDHLAVNNVSNVSTKVDIFIQGKHTPDHSIRENSLGRRTEVYHNPSVCRGLFKNDTRDPMNSQIHAPLDDDVKRQMMLSFDAKDYVDVKSSINHSRKEIWSNSDDVCETAVLSIPKIARNKTFKGLSGVERAHLEENQKCWKKKHTQNWQDLRKLTIPSCQGCECTSVDSREEDAYQNSVDWDAVRQANVEELAATIKERGMHHVLSGRIKAFLRAIHEEQGNLDLEWLRKVSPEDAKAYLAAVRGLGGKSVDCIRLLTLHHVAFPVDVNVGRICVRLGWVPIEPLPEQLQLHLLELYPVQETIQKYLWPRLCALDQKTLYELHCQLITFGKVFCTKTKPNCNACPMRSKCRHFASAYASAKYLLTGSNVESLERLDTNGHVHALTNACIYQKEEAKAENVSKAIDNPQISEVECDVTDSSSPCDCYYVEEPQSPETICNQDIGDIEDVLDVYETESNGSLLKNFSKPPFKCISTSYGKKSGKSGIQSELPISWDQNSCNQNRELFFERSSKLSSNYQSDIFSMERASWNECKDCEGGYGDKGAVSNALVSLTGAVLPAPKLKKVDRLRTIHYVYELPDTHPLLQQADAREKDDPSCYLLAIWSQGETPSSIQGPDAYDACTSSDVYPTDMVRGTLLVPCRTALRGKFPLNGTYFQVNEVFADHNSSLQPLEVPRSYIWSLQRRYVYFGKSVSSIFRGLTFAQIRGCFLQGYICVRGFDRETRAPRPLVCGLHFPIRRHIQKHKK